jgi:hypothetical protein
MKALRVVVVVSGAALALTVILFFFARAGAAQTPPAAQSKLSGPDLVIEEIILSPPNPHTTEPATITVRLRNQGDASSPGSRTYLYIDPPDRPPTMTTVYTHYWGYFITLPAGGVVEFSYAEFTFTEPGCDHVVYAWADRDGHTNETDETNNMEAITVCVEHEAVGADDYEPDDICSQSSEILTDGTPQIHNFDPQEEVDWVKFHATAGVTYTIAAVGTGAEAWPIFDLGDSCDIPSSFGTTSRLVFAAPTTGWYYLRLENNQADYDPVESSYELAIRAEATGVQPDLTAVGPVWGYNDRNTNVVITGTNFAFPPMAELCPYQVGTCGHPCTQLLDTSWVSAQRLYAIVQANLDPGDYCLEVTNPGGKVDALPQAFTVLSGPPELREIRPTQGYADLPTDLHVYGFNFAPGISVTLGGFPLENVVVINRTHLRATVPEGLSPGTYDLRAFYGTGGDDTLPNAFTVIAPEDDLFAQAQELWVDPVVPRAGEVARLGLLVHRQGGSSTLAQVPVRFSAAGQALGDAHVPLLPPDGEESTTRLDWMPSQPGDYQITAVIDPDGQIPEASEANNTVTRTVIVLSPAADEQAPHVDSLVIEGGRDVVTDTLVHLSATATDYPQPDGEGVSDLRYIEFEYNQGARLWIPVQDSGWVSYTLASTNYPWTLTPVGGVHYIQAWARDGAGNVSHYPYQRGVNYLPPSDWVGRNQTRVYRQTLAQGASLQVTLTPLWGDPDLYVWPPDWQDGRPPWVSNLSDSAVDQLSFTAPVSGVYQIEVYGYTAAQYQLNIIAGATAALARQSPVGVMGKPWPLSPSLPITGAPPRDFPQHRFYIYMPVVQCNTSTR